MWQLPKSGGFFPGKPYVDRGIGGQTTPQMVLRFREDVIALQPKVVVILAGTNDIAGNTGPMTLEETEGNMATMAELARGHGIRVVLSSVMPVNDVADADGKSSFQTEKRPPGKILALNEWIKKYAADNGYVYLDYFPATADEQGFLKSEMTNDGLHPNAQGYAVMGPLAAVAGTVVLIWVAEATVKVALVPLKATAVVPVRLVPVIVTAVPAPPLVGLKLVIVGVGPVTVKLPPLPAAGAT
jgi:lysophospholipase L1-like esterase